MTNTTTPYGSVWIAFHQSTLGLRANQIPTGHIPCPNCQMRGTLRPNKTNKTWHTCTTCKGAKYIKET